MKPDLEETNNLGAVAWQVLFGVEPETIPNPNKPENIPHIEAVKKEKIEQFKRFALGPGKPLFDQWQKKVRVGMFDLLIYAKTSECRCELSNMVDKLQFLVKLISKAQKIVNDKSE